MAWEKSPKGRPVALSSSDACHVAEESGSVAGIEVADGAEIFVITTGKRGTGANAALRRHDGPVEFEAEFGHGVGFVDIFGREQFRRAGTKGMLGGGNYCAVVFDSSRHIEQAEDHTAGSYPHEIVEIASLAFAVVGGGQFGGTEIWNLSLTGS